jgi:hypothetical protein
MFRLLPAALAAATLAFAVVGPVAADEFTATVEGALEAYHDGDLTAARQDLDYATKLLAAMKAESLAKFLPAALPGWTRADQDAEEAGGMMAMMGGGSATGATYTKDDGTEMTINLVANSPMVTGIAGMIGGLTAMGGGKPLRIQRTEFADSDGELQGVVDGKVLISVSGDATVADKTAYLEAMDFKGLGAF